MDPARKGLVLDANILVDAVLGTRVRLILDRFDDAVAFFAPDTCLSDARRRVQDISSKLDLERSLVLGFLAEIEELVRIVEQRQYQTHERDARPRIPRDPDDWPVIATALALDLPIWTEDRDFFGCGIATWITNTVEIYLRD